jgi:cytochrome c oxidase subunit 2
VPLIALLLLTVVVAGCATDIQGPTPQSTTVIAGSYNQILWVPYTIIFWLAGIVFVVIMVLTLYISIRFRERPGVAASQFHGNTRLEILWTLIPVAIVVIMAVPTVQAIQATAAPPPADAIKVTAIGHQWWFEFVYADLNGKTLTTANELHIPEGKFVQFEVRSQDVIHAFWVPQLAGKVDMVPGHVNEIGFMALPGKARTEPYLGQCAELCGLSHARMRFRVYVDTAAGFNAWVAANSADAAKPTDTAATKGAEVFARSACIGCHTIKGTAAAGLVGPNLTHVGSRSTIAAGTLENTAENLQMWISNSADVKTGSKMPAMAQSHGGALTDEEIKAVAAYLLTLK